MQTCFLTEAATTTVRTTPLREKDGKVLGACKEVTSGRVRLLLMKRFNSLPYSQMPTNNTGTISLP